MGIPPCGIITLPPFMPYAAGAMPPIELIPSALVVTLLMPVIAFTTGGGGADSNSDRMASADLVGLVGTAGTTGVSSLVKREKLDESGSTSDVWAGTGLEKSPKSINPT